MFLKIKNEIMSNFTPNVEPGEIPDMRSEDDSAFLKQSKATLDKLEGIRLEKLALFERRKKISIPIGLLITPIFGYIDYLLLFLSDGDGGGITFLALGALYMWVTAPKRAYAKAYKEDILPQIARLFGNLKYDITGKITVDKMRPSKILPHHDRYRSEDYFTGTYKGVHLEFSEIDLSVRRRSKNRTRYVTVFKGLAVLLHTKHKRFFGHTLIKENRSKLEEWFAEKSHKLERAEMVDPEFEKLFDAYTNDQVEARYLIDPIMIERLKGLYTEYEGEKMAAAFYDDKILILIASKYNHFEPANIYVPASNPASVLSMKKEVSEILSIIDKLSLYDPQDVLNEKQNTERLTG